MQLFIQILTKISEIQNVVKANKELLKIIAVIIDFTQKKKKNIYERRTNYTTKLIIIKVLVEFT